MAPSKTESLRMMEPFRINGVEFKNRIIRSSIGGQMCDADGSVTSVFRNFERRFAKTGVAGLISATVGVNTSRLSPIYYPSISDDRFVGALRGAIAGVKAGTDCKYIVQIGDPGYHTQTSLFSQEEDAKSASSVFDMLYGYRNRSLALKADEIPRIIDSYVQGARRVKEAGADGVELTASKGYLIQQFLNPWSNRRRDQYGGSTENRFLLLRQIVEATRAELGTGYLFGVRISVRDHNWLPVNLRWPPRWPLRHWFMGNDVKETLYFAKELEQLGVDYLHLTNGFGFIHPKGNPGAFPVPEARIVFNANRHLSFKAWLRAAMLNLIPKFLLRAVFGIGWNTRNLGETGKLAAAFREAVKIPLIANGGFQSRQLIEDTLASGSCDMVAMARPLLANPDLLTVFQTRDEPERPCTFCNRCAVRTAIGPVGCFEPKRYQDQAEMETEILRWATDPDVEPLGKPLRPPARSNDKQVEAQM